MTELCLLLIFVFIQMILGQFLKIIFELYNHKLSIMLLLTILYIGMLYTSSL